MHFATWNILKSGATSAIHRINLLKLLDWDVIALQEVSPAAWDIILQSQMAESYLYSFSAFNITPNGRQPHGVALCARNGLRLSNPDEIPHLPKTERGLAVQITGLRKPTTVASWHAPNAASEGVEVKMKGYRGVIDWLNTVSGPVVFGFDGNHWNRSIELEPPYIPYSDDKWLLENRFYGSNKLHRLRDSYLEYLRHNSEEYEKILKLRPEGPLAISYVRGRKAKPIPDRFDYIFISEEIDVLTCSYYYGKATRAGSDHGIVIAELELTD